jgi:hypothetical protein
MVTGGFTIEVIEDVEFRQDSASRVEVENSRVG